MKMHAMTIGVVAFLFGACASIGYISPAVAEGGDESSIPAPSQALIDVAKEQDCRDSTVFLSVIFNDGNPTDIGGGEDAGTGDHNDKKVPKKDYANNRPTKICWIGILETGHAANIDFAILFDPEDKPNPDRPFQAVKISEDVPKGVHYKYTVWRRGSDENEPTSFLDPRIVIN